MLDPGAFKAYDVRGLYPSELDEAGAYAIGRAFVEQFEPARIPFQAERRELTYALKVGGKSVVISALSMGNPHAVFFVPDLKRIDAADLGSRIEIDPMFPQKANVTFAQMLARDDVRARVWERGVGLTLACGSAACATLVAAVRLGLMERKGTVRLPGGDLIIEWRAADDHVLMTGPVEYEGAFTLDEALFQAAAL